MLQFTPPVVKELLGWKRGEMSAQVIEVIFLYLWLKLVSFVQVMHNHVTAYPLALNVEDFMSLASLDSE